MKPDNFNTQNSKLKFYSRICVNGLRTLLLLLILSFIIIEALVIKDSFSNDEVKVDYVVVLGAGIFGETPSPALSNRLNRALEYIKEYPDVKIVVSGGQGPNELISEAEAMRRFMLDKGVGGEQLIKEDKSTNTMENLVFTKKILDDCDVKAPKIMIVTNEFHVFRSKFLARRIGFTPYAKAAPSPTYPRHLKTFYFLREYLAVIKSLIFDRIS